MLRDGVQIATAVGVSGVNYDKISIYSIFMGAGAYQQEWRGL